MYVCIYIIVYNEFKKARTANRVPFLNTETTEEERQPSPEEQFLPWNWSLHHCNSFTTISGVDGLPFSSPSQRYISSACGQDWQNGVRTWRKSDMVFSVWGTAGRRWPWRLSGMTQTGIVMRVLWFYWEYRRSESVLNEETQSRDLPLCLHLYLILVKSWTFWAMDTS